ncbi:MAG: alanine dehydrogenase [Sulfurimonas sp. RIFOXYD12_FULL_33_39]|uniref:alanine dehydrogenase n=1 Tax=unclassified Sulfurimonas TaxID=2623549 RepID=UPI0008CDF4C6|nr:MULTISPECIES: alanine dehydrogenase [unclassified Sulfurimonas]OHE07321.1 MAG: alanine dehydrogenase [Sulfurimonas sp. RIFCSPLOWO2_12_FULL_34_6]OHE09277.1 MAG: alanine dehydrogenase [Sulfurimonas sp. RIFOXYD12_FULL_33_39]OHE12940.1 MAG: alanine dehydrogenase [Sulfurimonas sp. RIFOXYD2_FULL_34_21]DAB27815.1 MAG TPA: alanine dehydrogenase [Sulfurimonas sp. UBA10385]
MIIGIPKEVKTDEYRVGITPLNVGVLIKENHKVIVQSGAGDGSGFSDDSYLNAGAQIVSSAKELYNMATLIVKVKEPQSSEYDFLNEKHTLFCYLHLAPLRELTSVLVEKKVCAIAYETVAVDNELPLLKPMSEIAGKMAPIVAAYHLSRYQGGEGVLISGTDGVPSAKVLVIGAGNAGFNAAKIALGMGADVTVINRSAPKLQELQKVLPHVKTALYSTQKFEELLKDSDIVISSVLIHGGSSAPKLITRDMLKSMKNGAVFVDIAIDQGGTAESSRPTTHTNPVFTQEGVLHYCVANMPGAYPKTASVALSNATISYVKKLSNGVVEAIKNNSSLALGVNVFKGHVTNLAVSKIHGFEFKEIESCLREISSEIK